MIGETYENSSSIPEWCFNFFGFESTISVLYYVEQSIHEECRGWVDFYFMLVINMRRMFRKKSYLENHKFGWEAGPFIPPMCGFSNLIPIIT